MLHVLVQGDVLSEADREGLRAAFSRDPRVRLEFSFTRAEMLAAAPRANVIFGKGFSREVLDAAAKLKWVQAGTAGVDGLVRAGVAERGVVVTNARGAHGIPIAENILAMALCFVTRMHLFIRAQRDRGTPKERALREKTELHGQTMVVVGLGDIGGTLAEKARGLGMRVLGIRRSGAPHPFCDVVFAPEALARVLPEADHVALCLPLTGETHGILGERELRLMKRSAYVYNVGRGASIEPNALRRALAERWIAGAGLDCVAPSDVPDAGDPLWDYDDVILSMHTSGSSPFNSQRIATIFANNLRAYLDGRPLENVVDLERGY